MRPTFSIIFFTTASGAGYGLLFLIGLYGLSGDLPNQLFFLVTCFGIAFAFISAGLASSTFHLGNPQRAWRALSQWRTSWLSREGVMAVLTYPIAFSFAAVLIWPEILQGYLYKDIIFNVLALMTSVAAALTVLTTANIYASLKTIPQWHHGLVTPNYLLLAAMTGSTLFLTIAGLSGYLSEQDIVTSIILMMVSLLMKRIYWRDIDQAQVESTPETATGLGKIGTVRSLEHPHSQANWVMREMGFEVARHHTRSLRMICLSALISAIGCVMIIGVLSSTTMIPVFAIASFFLVSISIIIERWLLFAEAKHVVMNFYQ